GDIAAIGQQQARAESKENAVRERPYSKVFAGLQPTTLYVRPSGRNVSQAVLSRRDACARFRVFSRSNVRPQFEWLRRPVEPPDRKNAEPAKGKKHLQSTVPPPNQAPP